MMETKLFTDRDFSLDRQDQALNGSKSHLSFTRTEGTRTPKPYPVGLTLTQDGRP